MADSKIGIKLGVEGEKEFKNALRDINQSFKVLGSEMQLVTSQFDKNDKSAAALTARNTVLNKEIDTQKEKIATLQSALSNASDSFGEADKRTQNWQIQLNKAQAELNNMEREIGDNEKALDSMGDEMSEAEKVADKLGDELEETGETADDAGGKFEKLASVLKGIGAAMATAFVAVGAAAIGATKALAEMSVETAAYADEILTLSTNTGMSTESLQAYKYAAELVDVPLETLTKSMAKQIKSMDAARNGNDKMAAAYEALGVSVSDVNGNQRDGEEVYWQAIDALGKMEEGAERDALAMQIFGKSAQELNSLIAVGSDGMAELTNEAHRMGAVMSDAALEAAGEFDDTVQRLTAGSAAAKNALGMVLMPQLNSLGTIGVDLLGDFTRGLNEAGGDWSKISEVIGETVGGAADAILEQLPQIIEAAMSIVGAVGSAIVDNLPLLVDTASQIIMTILEGLIFALPEITNGAVQLVLALVNGILENLPALVTAAIQMIGTLVQGIAQALPELIPVAVSAVVQIVQALIDNLPMILDAALQLVLGLAQGILAALPELISALPAIITGIVDFIIGAIPQIIQAGIQLLVSLVQNLPTIIAEIVKAIPQIITSLVSAIVGFVPKLAEAGLNLIKGVWQGISDAGSWLRDKISGFFGGVVDGIKSFFGIKSPSTLFKDQIGKNLALGVGEGFTDEMDSVTEDMQNALPDSLDADLSGLGAELANDLGDGFNNALGDRKKGTENAAISEAEGGVSLFSSITELCQIIREQVTEFARLILGIDNLTLALQGLNIGLPAEAGAGGVPAMVNHFYFDNITVRRQSDMEQIAEFTLRKLQIALNNRGVRV